LDNCETLWIETKTKEGKICIIGVIYRHPNSSVNNFISAFENTKEKLNDANVLCYISGYINIDLAKDKPPVKQYSNSLLKLGC